MSGKVKGKISHGFRRLQGSVLVKMVFWLLASMPWLAMILLLLTLLVSSAGRCPGAGLWDDSNQPVTADNDTKKPSEKAGSAVGHGTRNCPPLVSDWLDGVIEKIHFVESGGRLNPPDGDGGRAAGPLQLHKCTIDDVNFYYGQNFTYTDRYDLETAKQIAKLYIAMWMHLQKEEIACRIFNGGPRGWQKKSTDGYWEKIRGLK
jgi:hypothetical protein